MGFLERFLDGLSTGWRLLVGGLLILLVAIVATTSGVWRIFSESFEIGNPDAQVSPPKVSAPDLEISKDLLAQLQAGATQAKEALDKIKQGKPVTEEGEESLELRYAESLALLSTIPTSKLTSLDGYDRTGMFGAAWKDVTGNGCSTRDDILARDLVQVKKKDKCVVTSGVLFDPYTAKQIDFVRGPDSSKVQIDHVVALANAWRTGAQELTQDQRLSFANDPLNLLAVDGPANMAKGASDAGDWLPKNKEFQCEYASLQTQVKAKYQLWMTPKEHKTIEKVLNKCV